MSQPLLQISQSQTFVNEGFATVQMPSHSHTLFCFDDHPTAIRGASSGLRIYYHSQPLIDQVTFRNSHNVQPKSESVSRIIKNCPLFVASPACSQITQYAVQSFCTLMFLHTSPSKTPPIPEPVRPDSRKHSWAPTILLVSSPVISFWIAYN